MSVMIQTKKDVQDMSEYTILQCPASGQHYLNGLSSSYSFNYNVSIGKSSKDDEKFSSELVRGVITDKEINDIINRLNEQIISFWPCTTCFLFAYSCIPCTFGFSLMCPNYCISQAEDHAIRLLDNLRYYY
jgi:hypothetical protein